MIIKWECWSLLITNLDYNVGGIFIIINYDVVDGYSYLNKIIEDQYNNNLKVFVRDPASLYKLVEMTTQRRRRRTRRRLYRQQNIQIVNRSLYFIILLFC